MSDENDEATIRHALRGPVEPVLRAQFATIRRLRALIKKAERAATDNERVGRCPWCGWGNKHADTCPAFTADGAVR